MNPKLKIGIYAILIIGAVVFGALFYSSYKNATPASEPEDSFPINVPETRNPSEVTSNEVDQANQPEQPNADTNISEVATNASNAELLTTQRTVLTVAKPVQGRSRMIGYFAAFLAMSIFLGLMIARDLSEYFGSRSVEFMFNDDGVGIKNPEYEQAEQEWANGHHLDAIRMMREYLTNHPREQYVALRIAEIYEKDLKNHLAAALEYEEILKHKLPAQRWGWAAIHLCNLYSKMGKTDEAVTLLHRIVNEYGETPAAEKARKRLAMFESVGEEGLDGDLPDSIQPAAPPKTANADSEKPSAASSLPPGFRPKK